jgi:hypothetical protein
MTTATISSKFICQYWDALACDPTNWIYEPSTYEVAGVELVGSPHMKRWDALSHWRNPGRADGVSLSKVEELKEDIQTNGIRIDKPVIYYDVDTNETVNGDHRFTVSNILGIVGWMCQGVRFSDGAAKIRFASRSNVKERDIYNPVSPADVNAAVRELISIGAIVTDDAIKAETRFLGKGSISESAVKEIYNKIIIERVISGKSDGAERFQPWNDDRLSTFFDKTTDKWVEDYWDNDSEYTIYVNMGNFSSRWGSIISIASQAVVANKPLHFLLSVKLMANESLDTTRSKVFSDKLAQLEQKLCFLFGLDPNRHKHMLPWHHSECEHRFLPQDSEKEDFKLLVQI